MEGPIVHPPSVAITGHFAENTKKLQGKHMLRALNMEGDVFGGFVRSYGFDYDVNTDIAQGTMWIDFGTQSHIPIAVTVVILGGTEEDAQTAKRMVAHTAKLSDLSDLVLDAYFCTLVESIKCHIVVYEQFDGPFFGGREQMVAPFFRDGEGIGQLPPTKYRLTTYWVEKMRSVIDLLEHGRRRSVTHGSLANEGSYVISSGTVKLINVSRYTGVGYIGAKDVTDLRTFIKTKRYFNAASSEEWGTFDMLLGSNLVINFWVGWKTAVVGHPILQESTADIITAFDGVHKSVTEIGIIQATKLANLLCHKFPYFRTVQLKKKATTRSQRQKVLAWFFPPDDHLVLKGLFRFSFPGNEGSGTYGDETIHLEVIHLDRNFIHHAPEYLKTMADPEKMLRALRDYFTYYISAAYSLLHMLNDDPTKTSGPYKCSAEIKPTSEVTFGDFLENPKPMKKKK